MALLHVLATGSHTPPDAHVSDIGSQNSEQQSLASAHVAPTGWQVTESTQRLVPPTSSSQRPVQHSAAATQPSFTLRHRSLVPNAQRLFVHVPEQHSEL